MATYTNVDLAKTATLVASTVDRVVFRISGFVSVVNHDDTSTIWVSVNGTDPVADADNNIPILPTSAVVLPYHGAAIELISDGTPKYTVMSL